MEERRSSHALHARPSDGILQRLPGQQSVARRNSSTSPALLRSRRLPRSTSYRVPSTPCCPSGADGSYLSQCATHQLPRRGLNYKIGNERLIKVTENASRKLNSSAREAGPTAGRVAGRGDRRRMLGLAIQNGSGGWSGESRHHGAVCEVRVVVDPKSALFVSGSLLDYSDDLQKGGFKVTNPNAVAHCSCGESFAA